MPLDQIKTNVVDLSSSNQNIVDSNSQSRFGIDSSMNVSNLVFDPVAKSRIAPKFITLHVKPLLESTNIMCSQPKRHIEQEVCLYKVDNKNITQKMVDALLNGEWTHDLVTNNLIVYFII